MFSFPLALALGFSASPLSHRPVALLPTARRASRVFAETRDVSSSKKVITVTIPTAAAQQRTIQQQQEELARVLARVAQLEEKIKEIEAERSRGPLRRLGGAVGSHLASTSAMLAGQRALPGMRRLRTLASANAEANLSAAVDRAIRRSATLKGEPARFQGDLSPFLPATASINMTSINLTSLAFSSAASRSASAAVDLAKGVGTVPLNLAKASVNLGRNTSAKVTTPILRTAQDAGKAAIGLVDGLVLEYVPSTQVPSLAPAQSPAVAALLKAGVKQQLYDSRRVLLACVPPIPHATDTSRRAPYLRV